MHTALLLAVAFITQSPAAAFEFRNQTSGDTVWVWVWSYDSRGWVNNGQPLLLRPRASSRMNLNRGSYYVVVKSDYNADLALNRVLAAGEVDRLQIMTPKVAAQMRTFAVQGGYANDYKEAVNRTPMRLPPN
jgi:hypothetical protein